MLSSLGQVTLNSFAPGEPAAYPTPCKGRYVTHGRASYLFEEPVALNAISILPELKAAGVTALKIEGRQRSRAYVTQIVGTFRRALDALARGDSASVGDRRAQARGRGWPRDLSAPTTRGGGEHRRARAAHAGAAALSLAGTQAPRFLFPHRGRGAGRHGVPRRGRLLEARAFLRAVLRRASWRDFAPPARTSWYRHLRS